MLLATAYPIRLRIYTRSYYIKAEMVEGISSYTLSAISMIRSAELVPVHWIGSTIQRQSGSLRKNQLKTVWMCLLKSQNPESYYVGHHGVLRGELSLPTHPWILCCRAGSNGCSSACEFSVCDGSANSDRRNVYHTGHRARLAAGFLQNAQFQAFPESNNMFREYPITGW